MKKKLPKSVRKFIRKEKARIRREVLDIKEQEKLINGLYEKFLKNPHKSAEAVSTKQDIKNKQPVTTKPAKNRAKISANPVRG
jgi:hypothetical protein